MITPQKITIALFDFDGTLTKRDSLWAFMWFDCSLKKIIRAFTYSFPALMGYFLGYYSTRKAKETLFRYLWGGEKEEDLLQRADVFFDSTHEKLLKKSGLARIQWHQQQGHVCYLVTASLSLWTKPFADRYGLILVATLPEISEGVFTGNIQGENCYGTEKVLRLKLLLANIAIEHIYAYGDTKGDKEMLEYADTAYYRFFQ